MNRILLLVCIIPLFGPGCHPSPSPPARTLVQTPSVAAVSPIPDTDSQQRNTDAALDTDGTDIDRGVVSLIERDAHSARDILVSALHSGEFPVASWAAVYVRLLGVEAPTPELQKALLTGAGAEDPLLQALCLRWLVDTDTPLPDASIELPDPVHQLFHALDLLAKHHTDPREPIADALAVGNATYFVEEKVPLNTLLLQTAPFDDGSLALAIAFINARRMEIATTVQDITVPLSAQYRHRLLEKHHLHPTEETIALSDGQSGQFTFSGTRIHGLLENPLFGQPFPLLRNAIMTADQTLGIDALRGLAATALHPEVADFAATATALQSRNPQTRVEAARTYLMLVARATRKD